MIIRIHVILEMHGCVRITILKPSGKFVFSNTKALYCHPCRDANIIISNFIIHTLIKQEIVFRIQVTLANNLVPLQSCMLPQTPLTNQGHTFEREVEVLNVELEMCSEMAGQTMKY